MLQALGIALKLTLQGANQFVHVETYFCILVGPFPASPRACRNDLCAFRWPLNGDTHNAPCCLSWILVVLQSCCPCAHRAGCACVQQVRM